MEGNGVFDHQYERFYENRDQGAGYDFQHGPGGSQPVPKVTFAEKLRWWTIDRWRRRKQIRQARDRRLQEILNIKARQTGGDGERP